MSFLLMCLNISRMNLGCLMNIKAQWVYKGTIKNVQPLKQHSILMGRIIVLFLQY